ncbi:hypothetical protein LCGC14_0720180 [marine sediment metagenome]|uniref:Uncharacterized protein n=1 Tax=marine sediment metagenome TaxID=412755 RepID=A0A0F9QGU0_9ZZZZ
MENNDIPTYKKLAEIVSEIINPDNYQKARVIFDRLSINKNPVLKFDFNMKNQKQKNTKNSTENELTITKLPIINELVEFFQANFHKISQKKNCKAEYCTCKIKYNEDRLFHLMWEYVYYVYFPEEIEDWEELNDYHLRNIEYGYRHESLPYYKILLIQQIREILSEIRHQFPESTLYNKNGLDKCINEKIHNITFLRVVWESETVVKNTSTGFGYGHTSNYYPKYIIEKAQCRDCWVEFYILKRIDLENSNYNSIIYSEVSKLLWHEKWEALKEFYSENGLTDNQAEVIAKSKLGIPLKKSTLRNSKSQIKKKLDKMRKLVGIWSDIEDF